MTVLLESALKTVLDWMDKQFTGDLNEAALYASDRAKQEGLVSGPLWDEIGVSVLKHTYKTQRLHATRNEAKRTNKQSEPTYSINPESSCLNYPVFVNGTWHNLMDLTKSEVEEIASHYNKLAQSNAFERDFLLKVAGKLKSNQTVKDVFPTIDALRALRRKT